MRELDFYATVKTSAELSTVIGLGGGEQCSVPLTGTKALMLAVLEEGIRSYVSDNLRIRREAERWIMSNRRRSAFSFIVICEILGFEPTAVRQALRLLGPKAASPKAIARSRSNVRRWARFILPPAPKRRRSRQANVDRVSGGKMFGSCR